MQSARSLPAAPWRLSGAPPGAWIAFPFDVPHSDVERRMNMSIRDLIRRQNDKPSYNDDYQQRMNRFFDEFFGGGWSGAQSIFSPEIEISEEEKYVDLTAELPGMSEKDIELTLTRDRDAVVLRGEKKFEEEEKEKNYVRTERRYGSFQRLVPLPSHVSEEGIEASFKDGVLHVHMPKSDPEEHGVKSIPVKRAQ